jgi:hypothetical protein
MRSGRIHAALDAARTEWIASRPPVIGLAAGPARRMSSPGLSPPRSPEFGGFPPEFAAFLFAQICEEKSGMPLSVVSALARFGVDPWREAARLAALPSKAAVDALAAMIARIADSQDPGTDTRKIAIRLIQLLPRPGSVPVPARAQLGARPTKYFGLALWQVCLIASLGAVIAYSIMML